MDAKRPLRGSILQAILHMAVISALQTLGNDPVAQNLALQAGSLTVTTQTGGTPGAPAAGAATGVFQPAASQPQSNPSRDKGAVIAGQIVRDYLRYRMWLAREMMIAEARQNKARHHD